MLSGPIGITIDERVKVLDNVWALHARHQLDLLNAALLFVTRQTRQRHHLDDVHSVILAAPRRMDSSIASSSE
jgi:hypothetical protein